MKIISHNVKTETIELRNVTESELEQRAIDDASVADFVAAIEAKKQAKLSLLERLGITEEESRLLLS